MDDEKLSEMLHKARSEASGSRSPQTSSRSWEISGFWRRVGAFLVDGLLLVMVGIVCAYLLYDFFLWAGQEGQWFGFSVALCYFGLLNSRWADGQTLGKRLLGIRVVDGEGREISAVRSGGRFVVLALPFYLNGYPVPELLRGSWFSIPVFLLLTMVIFGGMGAVWYLILFNRRTLQSLHDLVMGTYVIRTTTALRGGPPRTWNGHYLIMGFMGLVMVLGAAGLWIYIGPAYDVGNLAKVQRQLTGNRKINRASIKSGNFFQYGTARSVSSNYVSVTVFPRPQAGNEEIAREAASIVLEEYPKVLSKDRLSVTVTRGIDNGLVHFWWHKSYSYPPRKWHRILDRPPVDTRQA